MIYIFLINQPKDLLLSNKNERTKCFKNYVGETEDFKNVGAISGQNSGLIDDCHILNGSISIYAYKNGGVIDAYAGGISGYCYRDSFIKKCSNNCTIKVLAMALAY